MDLQESVLPDIFQRQRNAGRTADAASSGEKKEQLLEQYHCKKIREFLICCLVCLLLAVCGVAWGLYQRQQLEVSFVERPSYHQGDRQETLEAVRQDGTKETVSLQLSERVYTAAEAKERLKEAMDLLDKAFREKTAALIGWICRWCLRQNRWKVWWYSG